MTHKNGTYTNSVCLPYKSAFCLETEGNETSSGCYKVTSIVVISHKQIEPREKSHRRGSAQQFDSKTGELLIIFHSTY